MQLKELKQWTLQALKRIKPIVNTNPVAYAMWHDILNAVRQGDWKVALAWHSYREQRIARLRRDGCLA